jgi:formate transporter
METKLTPDEETNAISIDPLLPRDMARKAEDIGVKKAHLDFISTSTLAVMAGAFIALGAIFATIAWTGTSTIPYGWSRVVGGIVFSLGLILVIVGGAELFTGNNLIIMAWAERRVGTWRLLYNWGVVYLGNLIGAIATAVLMFLAGGYLMANGAVGTTALNIALTKVSLTFTQALMLGILCNALVCLAVWLCYSARSTIDKIFSIVFPIAAFVACGFEHCVANMYFIPYALLIKAFAPVSFWTAAGVDPAKYNDLTWGSFFVNNLIPVTLGNIIGGAVLVGLFFWLVYLRGRRRSHSVYSKVKTDK